MRLDWQKIKRWPLITFVFRLIHPHESTCGICGLPWSSCNPSHTVDMIECTPEHSGEGFFPVCEYCWQHNSFNKIKDTIIKLYACWEWSYGSPYSLDDMIEKAENDYMKI